jgi:hypothetical protein
LGAGKLQAGLQETFITKFETTGSVIDIRRGLSVEQSQNTRKYCPVSAITDEEAQKVCKMSFSIT